MLIGNVAGRSTPSSWHISRGITPSLGWRVVTRTATTAAGWCDWRGRPSDSLEASSSVRSWAYRPCDRASAYVPVPAVVDNGMRLTQLSLSLRAVMNATQSSARLRHLTPRLRHRDLPHGYSCSRPIIPILTSFVYCRPWPFSSTRDHVHGIAENDPISSLQFTYYEL